MILFNNFQRSFHEPHLVYNKSGFDDLMLRFEISVNTDISILGFYEYIKNIGKISMDVLTKMLIKRKLFKIHENI